MAGAKELTALEGMMWFKLLQRIKYLFLF